MRHLLLIAALLSACDVVDIELVNVPDGGMFQPPVGPACSDSSTCLAGQFCEKAACGEALGHCVQRPPVCDGASVGWVLIALQAAFHALLTAPTLEEGG